MLPQYRYQLHDWESPSTCSFFMTSSFSLRVAYSVVLAEKNLLPKIRKILRCFDSDQNVSTSGNMKNKGLY